MMEANNHILLTKIFASKAPQWHQWDTRKDKELMQIQGSFTWQQQSTPWAYHCLIVL